jgi:nucleoside-triphosphatase
VSERQRENLFILSGPIDSGKTSALIQLVTQLRNSGTTVGGILTPKMYHNSEFIGYDIELIRQELRLPLARLQPEPETFTLGRFYFFQSTFHSLLTELGTPLPSIFILDEIGPIELNGGGFAPALPAVLNLPATVLLTIREQCLTEAIAHFDLQAAEIIRDYEMLTSLLSA